MKKFNIAFGTVFICFATVSMFFVLAFVASMAVFMKNESYSTEINFSKGISLIKDEKDSGKTEFNLYTENEGERKELKIENAMPAQRFNFITPQIIAAKNTAPFFVRAKLEIKDKLSNENLSDDEVKQLFEVLPTFSKNWENIDQWHYLLANNSTEEIKEETNQKSSNEEEENLKQSSSVLSNMLEFNGGEDAVDIFNSTEIVIGKNIDEIIEKHPSVVFLVKVEYISSNGGDAIWLNEQTKEI